MQVEASKECTTCAILLPLSYYGPRKASKDGLEYSCRNCKRLAKIARRNASREEYLEKNNAYYQRKKDHYAEYRDVHKDRIKESKRLHYQHNKTTITQMHREYWKATRDKRKAARKVWEASNKHVLTFLKSKRRAAKLLRTPSWHTKEHDDQIKKIYADCRALNATSTIQYHVDHIVPLLGKTVCGLHVPWNLAIITAEENMRKNNKYDDWKDYAYQ